MQNTIEKYISLFSGLIGIIISGSFVISVIYDWGFYSVFGLNFDIIPTSLSDHFRSALIWVPAVITGVLAIIFNEILTRRLEQGLTEEEIINSSKNPDKTKNNRERPFKIIPYIAIVGTLLWVLFGDNFRGTLGLCLFITWIVFSTWCLSHPRIIERGNKYISLAIMFIPALVIITFISGQDRAISIFNTPSKNNSKIYLSDNTSEEGVIVRTLERGIYFSKNQADRLVFIEWRKIKKIEHQLKQSPFEGVLCGWFQVVCTVSSKQLLTKNSS